MPYRLDELAHKPYRPSNGAEGEVFAEQFCDQCIYDNYPNKPLCDIIAKSMSLDIEHKDYPKEWIHNGNGEPLCTKFKEDK